MNEACDREVHELHIFFETWFNGELPDEDEVFARFKAVLAPGFEMVGPDGRRLGREALCNALRGAHGRVQGDPKRIWIEDVRVRDAGPERWLVTYEEWHEGEGSSRGRLSSALLGAEADAPNGLVWHHVHETWLPG